MEQLLYMSKFSAAVIDISALKACFSFMSTGALNFHDISELVSIQNEANEDERWTYKYARTIL